MTEKEYIYAANLRIIRDALSILRNHLAFENNYEYEYSIALNALHSIESKLASIVCIDPDSQ